MGTLFTIRQLVPLSRHSTLPELQAFVKLFLPKRVVPNTLDPRLLGVDWMYIDRVFASCLHPYIHEGHTHYGELRYREMNSETLSAITLDDCDVALKNLVGNGSSDVAVKWADDGKLLKKLFFIKSHLGHEERQLIDRLLGSEHLVEQTSSPVRIEHKKVHQSNPRRVLACDRSSNIGCDSEDDSDGSEGERGRTAHALFASLAGIDLEDKENAWWFPSSPSSTEQELTVGCTSRSSEKGLSEIANDGAWYLNRLTPVSSPIRPLLVSRKVVPSTPKRLSKTTKGKLLTPSHSCSTVINPLIESPPAKGFIKSPIFLVSSAPDIMSTNHFNMSTAMQSFAGSSIHFEPPLLIQEVFQQPSNESSKLPRETIKSNAHDLRVLSSSNVKVIPRKRLQGSVDEICKTKKTCLSTHTIDAIPSSSPSNRAIPPVANQETLRSLSIPWVSSEREYWHSKRMVMSHKVAEALPHLVAPSYQKKRTRRLAQLERKTKIRLQTSASILHVNNSTTAPETLRPKLMQEPTIHSFDDYIEEKLDWNRSKMLAEAIREEVAKGRKPTIPPLQCAQSQSQLQP